MYIAHSLVYSLATRKYIQQNGVIPARKGERRGCGKLSWPNLALLTVTDHTAMTLFSVPVCLRGHSTPYSLSLTTNSAPIFVIYCCVTYYHDLASKQHSFIIPLFIWSGIWTPLSYFLCFSIPYKAVITVSTRAGVSSETLPPPSLHEYWKESVPWRLSN